MFFPVVLLGAEISYRWDAFIAIKPESFTEIRVSLGANEFLNIFAENLKAFVS